MWLPARFRSASAAGKAFQGPAWEAQPFSAGQPCHACVDGPTLLSCHSNDDVTFRGAPPAGTSPMHAGLTLPAAAALDASTLPGEHQPSRAQPAPTGALSAGAVPTEAGAHQAAGGGTPGQGVAGSDESGVSGAAQVHLRHNGGLGQFRAPSLSGRRPCPSSACHGATHGAPSQVGVLSVCDDRLPHCLCLVYACRPCVMMRDVRWHSRSLLVSEQHEA